MKRWIGGWIAEGRLGKNVRWFGMKKQKLDWKDYNGRLVKRGELLRDLEFIGEGERQLGAEARRAGVPERREEVEAEGRLRQGMGG